MNQRQSRRRWLLLLLLAIFGAMNTVAFFHAWRFTHFSNESGVHSPNPEQLGPGRKLWVLLTGIRNPKPRNGPKPGFPVETVTIASPNGPLEAWYARPDSGRARGTVALFHGYTSSKSHLTHEAVYFRRLGYNVLLVDQVGNGNSAGFRTTVGYREADDVAAAFRWLQDSIKSSGSPLLRRGAGAVPGRGEVNVRSQPAHHPNDFVNPTFIFSWKSAITLKISFSVTCSTLVKVFGSR